MNDFGGCCEKFYECHIRPEHHDASDFRPLDPYWTCGVSRLAFNGEVVCAELELCGFDLARRSVGTCFNDPLFDLRACGFGAVGKRTARQKMKFRIRKRYSIPQSVRSIGTDIKKDIKQ